MNRTATIIRWVLAVAFLGGGLVHLVLGRIAPLSYAAFGETAAPPALRDLWSSFVMPNIGWLTVLLGLAEIAMGVCMVLGGRATRLAAVAALAFFGFILMLGYAFPADSAWEDFLANRAFTLVLVAMAVVVLVQESPGPLVPLRSRATVSGQAGDPAYRL